MTRTQKLIWLIASALMVLYVSMYSASFADIGKSLEKAQPSENLQKTTPLPSPAPIQKPVPAKKQRPAQIRKPAPAPMKVKVTDDLVVERIWLDSSCQINISLLNRSRQRSSTNFSNLLVRIDYGMTRELAVSKLGPSGSLGTPGGRITFNTRITLPAPAGVTVTADSRNAIREYDERNNRTSVRLIPRCVKAGIKPADIDTRLPAVKIARTIPNLPIYNPKQAPSLTPVKPPSTFDQARMPQTRSKQKQQVKPSAKSPTFGSKAQTQMTPVAPGGLSISAQTKPLGTLSVPHGIKPAITKAGPQITSLLNVPLGALKPGSRVYVKGKGFGPRPGKILMSGNYPGSPIELTEMKWDSDTNVSGVVPMDMDGQMNQSVSIQIQLSDSTLSNPMNTGFQGRLEAFCDYHIIYLNDGSAIDCTPFACVRNEDVFGNPQCRTVCRSNGDCAPGLICISDGTSCTSERPKVYR